MTIKERFVRIDALVAAFNPTRIKPPLDDIRGKSLLKKGDKNFKGYFNAPLTGALSPETPWGDLGATRSRRERQ